MIELLRFWARCKQMWCLPVPTVNNMPAEFLKKSMCVQTRNRTHLSNANAVFLLNHVCTKLRLLQLVVPRETADPWTFILCNLRLLIVSGDILVKREMPSSVKSLWKIQQEHWGRYAHTCRTLSDSACQSQPGVSYPNIANWLILNLHVAPFWNTVTIKKYLDIQDLEIVKFLRFCPFEDTLIEGKEN